MPVAPPRRFKPHLVPLRAACLIVLVGGWAPTSQAWAVQSSGAVRSAAEPFRIIAFGSSSTQGTGASSRVMAYPAQLQRLFDEAFDGRPAVAVVNRGIAGEDIDDMVKRLDGDVLAVHPDLVIWQAGSNDSLRGVPMDRFEAELTGGIRAIRAEGVEVLLMEPQWSPVIEKADAKSRFVDAVREVGAEQHVEVVRRFTLMRRWIDDGLVTPEQLVGPDNLHMTDRGYALLARAVLDQITAQSRAFRDRRAVAAAGRP